MFWKNGETIELSGEPVGLKTQRPSGRLTIKKQKLIEAKPTVFVESGSAPGAATGVGWGGGGFA